MEGLQALEIEEELAHAEVVRSLGNARRPRHLRFRLAAASGIAEHRLEEEAGAALAGGIALAREAFGGGAKEPF